MPFDRATTGTFYTSPHGFSGNEFCAMLRYAGMSDTVSQLGMYEYNPRYDQRGQSAHLCAHALWYFFEGVSFDLEISRLAQGHIMRNTVF